MPDAVPRDAPTLWLMAGEASGDVLGARLMAALRRQCPGSCFAASAGARMEEQGLDSLFPMRELAVMGLVEILPRLRQLSRRLDQAVADIAARRPDLVVTIDSPGFALRLLRRIAGARHPARALRGAAGLGVARAPGARVSRACGTGCCACCRSSRPSSRGTGWRRVSSAIRCCSRAPTPATPPASAPGTACRRRPRCWC